MSQFQEDMIFKNVGEDDARILLDIIGKKSKKVKIWTKELRLLDPTAFKPDIILELDDEILIIEFQSTKVGKRHHRRFHVYVAITDYNVENHDKDVNLCVFTTAEESKLITYHVNQHNDFKYDVISLSDYDSEEIINIINYKIEHGEEITGKELVLFSLVPIIEKEGEIEDYIFDVVNTLIGLKDLAPSIQALVFGIEWLIVDKFVENENTRNILQDLLGDRMSMVHEYAERKKNNEQERIIRNLLQSGHSPFEIANDTRVPLSKVNAIKRKYHL
jgi:hypothetical protein